MGNHAFKSFLAICFILLFGNKSFAGPIYMGTGGCSFMQQSNGYVDKVTPSGVQCVNPVTGEIARTEYVTPAAGTQNQKRNAASAPQNKFKGKDCNSMEIPFSSLDYVEINFAQRLSASGGKCKVVSGNTDAQARGLCAGFLINPGNPQYRAGGPVKGNLSSNTLGYYFCIENSTTSFNKRVMCEEMRANQICKRQPLEIQFITRGGGDGDCMCGPVGTDSMHLKDCSQANLSAMAGEEVKCSDKGPGMIDNPKKDGTVQALCVCDTSKGFKDDGKGACTPPAESSVSASEISPDLVKCVQEFEERAAKCESSATQAKKTCDQKNAENPEVNDALGATDIVSEMFQRQNQGTGLVTECVKAGALAKSPKIILNALKEKCDANFDECSKSCSDDEVQKYTQQCGDIANKVAQAEVSTKGTTPNNNKNVIYYQERLAVIKKGQEAGTKMCKEDASSTRSVFADVLSGLGQSFLQAQRCACQAASTALGTTQSTCNSLPTSEQCLANPSLAGCPAVISVDICSPGSQNYSYQGCKCQQDPKAVGCPQYAAATPGLSGFAGTDIGSGSGGSGMSFGANSSGGGLNPGDLNLNGAAASDLASGNKSGGINAGFNGSPGGSGGSLGGVPGGGPEGGAGGAGDDGERGSNGGAFGFVKSIAGTLFGGAGGKRNDAGKGGGAASKFDPNKYRPNRGLAQEYGVGNKNSELWQLMHDGYEMNQPTFIPNP
jgi:hypothetical protein